MDANKLLVAICSCQANRTTKQRAVQDTWIKDLERLKVNYTFFEGSEEAKASVRVVHEDKHRLILPCGDDYYNLRDKTRQLCRWFVRMGSNRRYAYLFKCDDDTYVQVERLLQFDIGTFEYAGRMINSGYAAGGAYMLSKKAIGIVDDLMRPKNIAAYMARGSWGNNEDEAVGNLLRECGIELKNSHLFHHGNDGRPTPKNDSITGHHIQPEYMRRIWEEFNPSPPTPCPPQTDSSPESPHQIPGSDLQP